MQRTFPIWAAVLICAPAFASRPTLGPTDLSAPASAPGGGRVLPGGEDFETFPTGNLPINGWSSDFNPDFQITSVSTIQGTRSWRHTSDGSAFADTGFSPTFAPYFGFFASSVRIDGTTELNHWIPLGDVAATGGGTYFNTRVQFSPGGTIQALQVAGGLGVFSPTTGSWASGVTFQIASEVRADGSLRLYENGALIFTGQEVGFQVTGTAGRTLGWYSYSGDQAPLGQTLTVDQFTNVIPEPAAGLGTMLMVGTGVLARHRRQR